MGEIAFLRDEHIILTSHTKWSALKIYACKQYYIDRADWVGAQGKSVAEESQELRGQPVQLNWQTPGSVRDSVSKSKMKTNWRGYTV